MKKHCHGRRHSQVNASCGFALAETIIALLILSIALLAIAIVPIMSSKMAIQTTQRERAMSLAINRLDVLESVDYEEAVNSTDVAGQFTVVYTKAAKGSVGSVTVTWGGITGNSSYTLTRDLSEASSKVVQK